MPVLQPIIDRIARNETISRDEALAFASDSALRADLFDTAAEATKRFASRIFNICGIVSIKTGACSCNCKWCAQSTHWTSSSIPIHPILPVSEVDASAERAAAGGITRFSLVASGRKPSARETRMYAEHLKKLRSTNPKLELCASLGLLNEKDLAVLKADRPVGTLQADDAVLFINFRNDRARELTSVLTQAPQGSMHPLPLWFATMTPYDAAFKGLHVLFAKENVVNPIGEYVSSLGLKQLRIAETEKYAHVTFFLNGGREEPFANEDRILVPSPKVATYDLQPEMSAPEVAQKLSAALLSGQYDFICLNFANGDMVGHTGVWSAIEKAVRTVDDCVKQVIEAAQASGTDVVIIADHGNADHARNADGSPNTAHSLNPVPIIVVSPRAKAVHNGVLADVAPTVLTLMGVPVPPEMTGKPLVELKA